MKPKKPMKKWSLRKQLHLFRIKGSSKNLSVSNEYFTNKNHECFS